jgi:uncharacterized phage protein (TIGR01671 family)
MKPIKFRVWDGTLMLPAESIQFDTETVEVLIPCDAFGCEGHPIEYDFGNVVLMQYTGLKDRNGTEIYEGDILEITELSGRIGEYKVGRYTVNFDAGAYVAGSYRLGLVAHRAKVIGNIYKNPELLEGEE